MDYASEGLWNQHDREKTNNIETGSPKTLNANASRKVAEQTKK